MCSSSVELWLLYVRKRVRDATRHAATLPSIDERDDFVRQATIGAYELAVSHASFVFNNHLLWKQYLNFVKSWIPNPALNTDHGLAQKQMVQLRSVYQRLVTHPMTGLDQLWQEYEAFERGQSEHLATALIAEYAPKYQHARSVYLERNRVYNVADLQVTRLETPPVDESDEDYSASMIDE
jgi:cleavage stimulation factor subunit 3